jgi:hypothetical protein
VNIISTDLKERGYESWGWMESALDRTQEQAKDIGNVEHSGSATTM